MKRDAEEAFFTQIIDDDSLDYLMDDDEEVETAKEESNKIDVSSFSGHSWDNIVINLIFGRKNK